MKSFEETLVAAAVAGWTITIEPRADGIVTVAKKGGREFGVVQGYPLPGVDDMARRLRFGLVRWYETMQMEQAATEKP